MNKKRNDTDRAIEEARNSVAEEVIRILEKERPDADAARLKQLRISAPRIANYLHRTAASLEVFSDLSTVRSRLLQLWERRKKRRMRFILDSPNFTTPAAAIHRRKRHRTMSENTEPRTLSPALAMLVPKSTVEMPLQWIPPPAMSNDYYRICCELAQENVRLQRMLRNSNHKST